MSDNSELRDVEDNEAVQAVVDRVLSYQAGAPVETVRKELEDGLSSIEESRSEEWLGRAGRGDQPRGPRPVLTRPREAGAGWPDGHRDPAPA